MNQEVIFISQLIWQDKDKFFFGLQDLRDRDMQLSDNQKLKQPKKKYIWPVEIFLSIFQIDQCEESYFYYIFISSLCYAYVY